MDVGSLSLSDERVFGHLCRRGAMVFYMFRDIRPGDYDEFEVGLITESNDDDFVVDWLVFESTSGCGGLLFQDRYTRGQMPAGRWRMLHGGIIDPADHRSELCWSSMPVTVG